MIGEPGIIGRSKWCLDTPALVVDLAAMERNVRRMANCFRQAEVNWRPHTKGQKIPAIAHKLIAAGAVGITCAKLGEAEVMAAAGISDILVANQIVGLEKIARLVNLLPHADICVAVDNKENVDALNRAAIEKGVRLRVMVELNIGLNRAGVEPGKQAVKLSAKANSCEGLRFVGLMGWEGQATTIADPDEKLKAVKQSVGLLTETAGLCREANLPVQIVSCGGTGTYWITSRLAGVTEVQAGGGIFCDVCYRELMGVDHEYALTILASIISRPSPTRIICDAGRKAMSCDAALPLPLGVGPIRSVALSAEHALIELKEPNPRLRVGDKIEFVVGYSDTTVFLHDEMYGTRDGRVEVVWPILGRGKLR